MDFLLNILKFDFIARISELSSNALYEKIKCDNDVFNNLRSLVENIRKRKISDEDYNIESYKQIFTYAFKFIYGAVIKGAILIVSALLLGIFLQTVVVTGSFVILRMYAGGLHFKSYTKCTYVSLITLLSGGLLGKYTPYHYITSLLVFVFTFTIFFLFSPVENSNRSYNKNEKIKFKIISLVLLCVLFIAQYYIIRVNIVEHYVTSITVGTLLSGLIATPLVSQIE